MARAVEEAVRIVREADRDRYLSVLFAPEEKRPALFALYAFNVEIARVRDLVHEPLPGEIRLQWWRDAILGDTPAAGHPVAEALIRTIRAYELPPASFDNMIEARLFDLYDDPMPSRNDLEGYCGETASALIQLAALVLDRDAALATAEIAGHAGCAQAIAGLLRSLPIHLSRGQCYVPRDILSAAGTTPEAFVAEKGGAAAERAVAAMVALGRDHFAKFEAGARNLPAVLRPAYLPAGLAGAYLDRVERLGARAMSEYRDIGTLARYWILFRRASTGWA
jgi:phytoene synthase